jgi:uncharacterized protein (DUF362 family)
MGVPHSAFECSRRDALRALSLLPLAASACTRPPYRRADFTIAPASDVAVLRATGYGADLSDVVGRGLRELGVDPRGKRVLLKPNLVEYEPGTAINTNPALVAGAAAALLRAGAASVTVGEGPGHRRDTEYLLTATGLFDVLRDERLRFVDLNQDDVRMTPLRSRHTGLASIALPVEVLDADLVVSMPKLKTHHWAGMTASMKNLFGVVPGAVYGWPKNVLHVHGIAASILDLVATVRPGLAIVDAIVGMEGDGPIMGQPRPVGCVVMGTDPVAVDATCARLIGIEPFRVQYLGEASRYLGNVSARRIRQRGEDPARVAVPFALLDRWAELRRPLPFWRRWTT